MKSESQYSKHVTGCVHSSTFFFDLVDRLVLVVADVDAFVSFGGRFDLVVADVDAFLFGSSLASLLARVDQVLIAVGFDILYYDIALLCEPDVVICRRQRR